MPEFYHPCEMNAFVRERAETMRREAGPRTRMPNLRHGLGRLVAWLCEPEVEGREMSSTMIGGAHA